MKKFFKLVLANLVAGIILLFVFFLFLIGAIAGMAAMGSSEITVKDNSILQINMDYQMPDRAMQGAMPSLGGTRTLGLNSAIEAIRRAKTDDRIRGIFLNLSNANPTNLGTLQELRQTIEEFRESGKFVWAYSNSYSQGMFYLASVADRVYIHREGILDFRGLSSQIFFLKGTLEKLGVDMQIVRYGEFKSAVEPFMADRMSPENRIQTQQYLNCLWNSILTDISRDRNISKDELNRIADGVLAMFPNDAKELNMVDGVLSGTGEMLRLLAEAVDVEEIEDLEFIELRRYARAPAPRERGRSRDRIAVIYAQGEIVNGRGSSTNIGTVNIPRAIRNAANNDRVKAIVLRVNSPGGSVITSEIIRQEILAAMEKKPVVVSFGSVAASGGYWISGDANAIFAQPTTITGSIGVFGVIPNAQRLFNEKLGVTFDHVSTNPNADFLNLTRPMTSFERQKMQRFVDNAYYTFIEQVAAGRNLTKSHVDSIGQGRVWSGIDAKNLGLVDEIGGLQDAIARAAELAEIENFRILTLPREMDPFEQLMEMLGNARTRMIRSEMGRWFPMYEFVRSIPQEASVIARKPYVSTIQ